MPSGDDSASIAVATRRLRSRQAIIADGGRHSWWRVGFGRRRRAYDFPLTAQPARRLTGDPARQYKDHVDGHLRFHDALGAKEDAGPADVDRKTDAPIEVPRGAIAHLEPNPETRSARNAAGRTLLLKRLHPGDVTSQDEREGVQLRVRDVSTGARTDCSGARPSPRRSPALRRRSFVRSEDKPETRRPPYLENPAIREPFLWLLVALTKLIHINMLRKILRRRHGRLASPSASIWNTVGWKN